MCTETYAAVAAKTSALRALVVNATHNAKPAVNIAIMASLISGFLVKYKETIEPIKSTEAEKMLKAVTTCSIVASSYDPIE